jgi:hypothetical protein
LTWTTCAQFNSEEAFTRKGAGAYHLTPSVSASVFFYYNKVRFENCGPIVEKGAEKLYKRRRDVLHLVVSTPVFSEQRERERKRRFLCCRNIPLVMGYMTLMPTYFGFCQFLIIAAKLGAYRSFAT